MPLNIRIVSEKFQPLTIRRNMREAALEAVVRDLLLIASVRIHPPNLRGAAPLGAEVNVFSIRGIGRAVIYSLGGGQAGFLAARGRNCIDVVVAVTQADKRDCFSMRRPSMPVRIWPGNRSRRSAINRQNINAVMMVRLRLIADRKPFSIGRDAVV